MSSYDYITLTGTILPDTGDLLTQVQNEWKAAFGEDLIVTPDTPQGVMIAAEVIARENVLKNNAQIANQINPNLSGGVALDAIWALTGGERDAQSFSIVPVNLAGVPGTLIPTTITIKDPTGTELFINTTLLNLDSNGAGVATFKAINPGPIAAPMGVLTAIVNGVLGLETVTNPSPAILGTTQQSDQGSRSERKSTLALQGMSLSEAITSGLHKVQGVLSLEYLENNTSANVVNQGVTLAPHSIYVCVDGGLDLDVATLLNTKKTGGTGYNNGPGIPISVSITDPFSGQLKTILFDRPVLIPIVVQVFVRLNNSSVDAQTAVKQAILDYAAGLLEEENGFVVGASVSSFELAGAINREVPSLYVKDLKTSLASIINYQNIEIPIAVYQKATITISSIQVNIV